jgi:carbonic anhydrase/acetyltransferase-like protein (isoleucine patch superfamily)
VLIPLHDTAPRVHETAWIAPGAVLAGDVEIGERASVFYSAVVRADFGPIRLGARSNLQDGCVLHTDPGLELVIGSGVSVGHRAVLHGCRIEDDVLIGMGAIVMNRAVIGSGSVIAAGALVPEGVVVPPRSMVVGAPGRVRRETTDDELAVIALAAESYVDVAQAHAAAQALPIRTQQ